jgi:hypothetical protein
MWLTVFVSMTQESKSLNPLEEYLESRYGNGFGDTDIWTSQLRAAVKTYQWRLTGGEYKSWLNELSDEVPEASREAQVEFIVAHHKLWDVIYASRRAAVKAVPSLQELTGRLSLDDDFAYTDIADWLNANAPHEQRVALLHSFQPDEPAPPPESDWWDFGFASWLSIKADSLEQIAQAWQVITKPAEPMIRTTPDAGAIRAWSKKRGYQVGRRGRLPETIIRQYLAEQHD